jgi:hypothetical protein
VHGPAPRSNRGAGSSCSSCLSSRSCSYVQLSPVDVATIQLPVSLLANTSQTIIPQIGFEKVAKSAHFREARGARNASKCRSNEVEPADYFASRYGRQVRPPALIKTATLECSLPRSVSTGTIELPLRTTQGSRRRARAARRRSATLASAPRRPAASESCTRGTSG